jgi:hypothetical protein
MLRSEQGRLRITQINGSSPTTPLHLRNKTNITDITQFNIIIGRLFFAQLNGINQYFKTPTNYSNATQLTVCA